MKAEVLSMTDYLALPLIALVIFFAIFTLMLVWLVRPGARAEYAERAKLALEDDGYGHGPQGGIAR